MARRDDQWVRELYRAHWGPMVRLASLLLGSPVAAPDLVQAALVAVHQRRAHFEGIEQAEVYLRVAVVNRTRTGTRSLGGQTGRSEVLALVEALPQRAREVLVLRHHLGLADPDIAATLGISRSAVSSHAHRGLMAVAGGLRLGAAADVGPGEEEDFLGDPELAEKTGEAIRAALAERAEAVEVPDRLGDVVAEAARADRASGGGPGRFRWLLGAALVALLVGLLLPVLVPRFSLLGGGPQTPPTPTATPVLSPHSPPSLPTLQRDLPIYYVGADHLLYREFRDLPTQVDRLSTAVGAVLNVAPLDPAYSSLWAGGQVNSATVVGSRIIVDISASSFATFTSRQVAAAAINQVVYTAIGAVGDPTGERTVQILIDGSPNLPVIGTPVSDFTQSGTAPLGLLWILTPESGPPQAAGEITMRGYQQSVLTDATIRWEVLDVDENVVREGTVAATGNENGWRYWVAAVILPVGDYELRVWTNQAPVQTRHFSVA